LPEAELGAAAEREIDGEWGVGPAFSLPIPLFDQGQASTAAARAELGRARQRYAAAAVEVRSAARMARHRLLADHARVTYYRRVILPLRREITEATQLQYNAMQVSPFQLLLAKQAEIDAGVAYVEALRDYWVTRSQVEQVVSGRLPEMAQAGTMMSNTSGSSGRGRTSGGH
jgi:outer membrane protein, heavy metal efflux system